MSRLQARTQSVVNAPVETVWFVITDINQLHRVNPGVIRATGRMDKEGETRTCEIVMNQKTGTMVERLVELIPNRKTVWTIESDTMGMAKMLRNTRFVFILDKVSDSRTKIISETYYRPSNLFAAMMNTLLMKRTVIKAQNQILTNIKALVEK